MSVFHLQFFSDVRAQWYGKTLNFKIHGIFILFQISFIAELFVPYRTKTTANIQSALTEKNSLRMHMCRMTATELIHWSKIDYRVARKFCGLVIFCGLREQMFAVRDDGNFCWELIFAILYSSSRTFNWKKPQYFQHLLYGMLSHSSLYLHIRGISL